VSGATWNATGGYDGKGAYQINATSQKIVVPGISNYNITNNFTITFWIKVLSSTANANPLVKGSSTTTTSFVAYLQPTTITFFGTVNGIWSTLSGSYTYTPNKWFFVSLTRNDSGGQLYIDGQRVSTPFSAGTSYPFSSSSALQIGQGLFAGGTWNGSIDDIMIFNRSLSPEQINATFNNRTDLIVAQETTTGQNWSVEITPNDGYDDGQTLESNGVLIIESADTTAPTVTIVSPASNNTNHSTANILFNATIAETSIGAVNFSFDNATGIDFNATITNASGTWSTTLSANVFAEGRNTMRVFATDTVGNLNSSVTIEFIVDRTTPNVTLNFLNNPVDNSNFSIRSSNQTFNASVFDALLQVDTVYFWFDNGTSNDFNITGTNRSGQW
ncbi:MAG: LamG domain-containing protein, partial [Nanoarchaeota archaeon]